MRKIVKYCVAKSDYSLEDFEDKINELIENRWQPHEGIFMDGNRTRSQPMVRYEEEGARMRKIIKYCVVESRDTEDFENEVRGLIVDGWQPFGSIFIDGNRAMLQAMVMYEEHS